MGQLFIHCTLLYSYHRLQQREVLSAQAISSLTCLFCCWVCQLLDKYKRSMKIFIWVWHNVHECSAHYHSRGWNWDLQVRATSLDMQVQTVPARELTWPPASWERGASTTDSVLMPNVFWFVMAKVRSGWLWLPSLWEISKYFNSPWPPGSLEHAEVKLWFV